MSTPKMSKPVYIVITDKTKLKDFSWIEDLVAQVPNLVEDSGTRLQKFEDILEKYLPDHFEDDDALRIFDMHIKGLKDTNDRMFEVNREEALSELEQVKGLLAQSQQRLTTLRNGVLDLGGMEENGLDESALVKVLARMWVDSIEHVNYRRAEAHMAKGKIESLTTELRVQKEENDSYEKTHREWMNLSLKYGNFSGETTSAEQVAEYIEALELRLARIREIAAAEVEL